MMSCSELFSKSAKENMETPQQETIAKLQRIFDSFLSAKFAPTNSDYFEKLITHLKAKENSYITKAHFAFEWADKCLTLIHNDFGSVNPKVISFLLNLCALMMLNEWSIMEIRERKFVDRILFILNRDMQRLSPSTKLGGIRLMRAVSRYSVGSIWLHNSKAWRYLIDYCNNEHTLYVVREARALLYELIYKFAVKGNDEKIVLEILAEIIKPINENVFESNTEKITTINVDDRDLQHKLGSTLDLLSYIMQQTLESEERINLAHLCEVHFSLPCTIWKYTEMTTKPYFFEKILTALTSLNFAKLVHDTWTEGEIAAEKFDYFGIFFFNTMKFCIDRHDSETFLKLAKLNHILWKKLGPRAPKEIQIENERVCFENQLIIFHMMPLLFILKSKVFQQEELFDTYIMKIFDIVCEQTLRLCYSFRDKLYMADGIDVKMTANLAYRSIHGILSMENILERDQAVIVFQAMIYALREFIINSNFRPTCINAAMETNGRPDRAELMLEIPNVLYAALIGLQSLIQRYRITWKESIETICVVNCVAVILENPNLSSRLAVQALKLVQLSIEHFLSPNMALLVDNLQGSGLVCLGPIIVKRFHDPAWEVRDSNLELVTSIATISRCKFPAFQQFLIDYKICPIVYQMAQNDCEPYVRASALKCLAQLVTINMIWENDLSKLDIIEHLFFLLYNESEGIVRTEAVGTLTKIYENRKIPSKYKDVLYSTLSHCAIGDLHWEVKVNALHCWELEIEKQFTNQGMIDGTFPTVTFSREYKKIVTLTEKEINLRITKVFNELSQRGCLGVMLKCLHDDCDLEVLKAAVSIIHRLLKKLKKYDYESIINDTTTTPSPSPTSASPVVINSCSENLDVTIAEAISPTADAAGVSVNNPEDVIEGIIAAQDINLLIAACENQLNLNGNVTLKSHIDEQYYLQYANVSPHDFIATIKRIDLDQLVNNQREWFLCAESLSSLLDDILFTLKPHDASIFADCY